MTDPWGIVYVPIHEWLIFLIGKLVGIYASPMDPMGMILQQDGSDTP